MHIKNISIKKNNKNDTNSFNKNITNQKTKRSFLLVNKWTMEKNEMNIYSSEDVRDLLVRCFLHAHLDEVAERKKDLYSRSDYSAAKRSIIAEIRLSFKQVHEDFDSPTLESLTKVVNLIFRKQIKRGINRDIVNYHKYQMEYAISNINR